MRVALVHDYLNQYGGAERVLEVLTEIFPRASIYTLLYDKDATRGRFEGKIANTSFLDVPFVRKRHRAFIPITPLAVQKLKLFGDYDLIVSDSAGYAKGITYDPIKTKHISYCHTPLRYAWETEEYVAMKYKDSFRRDITNFLVKPIGKMLRKWDFKAGSAPDIMLANSHFIAEKIKKNYKRNAHVIHPPVDTSKFFYERAEQKNYYIAIGRLLHYKRFDLIIDAFASLRLPVKIIGGGPDLKSLKKRAEKLHAKTIEFVPFINDEEKLRKIYNEAKALVFPQVEDFGLVAAEAQSCGMPVIAYNAGGAKEIVTNGITGILFPWQTKESLESAIKKCEKMSFSREDIARSAKRFAKENFKKEFLAATRTLAEV